MTTVDVLMGLGVHNAVILALLREAHDLESEFEEDAH